MSARKREPWGPDIAGVLICAVVFGLLRGSTSPLGFTSDPLGFLAFCGIVATVHGYLQGRPDRQKRVTRSVARFIQERLSKTGLLVGGATALMLNRSLGVLLVYAVIGGAVGRCFQNRPERLNRITGTIHARTDRAVEWLRIQASRRKRR